MPTNSSSTHSLIWFYGSPIPPDEDLDNFHFGWDWFTASSEKAKIQWLALMIEGAMHTFPAEMRKVIIKHLLGEVVLFRGNKVVGDTDHQSDISLPNDREGHISFDFINDLKRALLEENVILIGGNDNDIATHDLDNGSAPIAYIEWHRALKRNYEEHVATKANNYWILYNKETGSKMYFDFNDNNFEVPIKATFPELVDLKITDFCTFGCKFCYQDSGPKGEHASLSEIANIAYDLKKIGTFEVVLGGGEPTFHPNFVEILEVFSNCHINVSFTTKSLSWIKDGSWKEISKYAKTFAYSVTHKKDVDELAALLKAEECNMDAVVHVALGTIDRLAFEDICEAANYHNLRLTLLGYKATGRGSTFKPRNYDWWIEVVKDSYNRWGFSIDTALAKEFENKLDDVHPTLYDVDEGKYSCYIDAVNDKMSASSFHLKCDNLYSADKNLDENILSNFAKY
jgi:hypothetical protein